MAIKFTIAFCLTYKKQWHIFGLLMLQKLLQVVLNFRTFHFCTTCIFVYYKFSAQIHLLYAELKLSHIADERTFQAITQWQCKTESQTVFCVYQMPKRPIPVATRSKAWVCGCSLARIAGLNHARDMHSVSCECCALSD